LSLLNQLLGSLARFLFAGWMAWALAATGVPVLCLFVLPELAWGLVQLLPVQSDVARAGNTAPSLCALAH